MTVNSWLLYLLIYARHITIFLRFIFIAVLYLQAEKIQWDCSYPLCHLHFQPLEVVSRYRDPQLQVGENYSYLFKFKKNVLFKHTFCSQ